MCTLFAILHAKSLTKMHNEPERLGKEGTMWKDVEWWSERL